MIRNTVWHGYQAVEFEAGGYEAMLIPGVGANLVKLRHRASGIDILRTPPPKRRRHSHRDPRFSVFRCSFRPTASRTDATPAAR